MSGKSTISAALFGRTTAHERKARNEKAVKLFENKQFREIIDSALIMISMTYGEGCETFRFARETVPGIFGCGSWRLDAKGSVPPARSHDSRRTTRRTGVFDALSRFAIAA